LDWCAILRTRFDPGKIINTDYSKNKTDDLSKITSNNISFQNFSDNHSTSSNFKVQPNISFIRVEDEVSSFAPKLFHQNPKKTTYDQHLANCNISKQENERHVNLKRKIRCGDCDAKDYELGQCKIKLRERNIEIKKLKNDKINSSHEQTPSSIVRNNSNLMFSGSFSMSPSVDSVRSSIKSEKVSIKLPHSELDNRGARNIKSSAILEEREEENRSASNDEFKKEKISSKVVQKENSDNEEKANLKREEKNSEIKKQPTILDISKEADRENLRPKVNLSEKLDEKVDAKIEGEKIIIGSQEEKKSAEISPIKPIKTESKQKLMVKEDNPLSFTGKDLIKNSNLTNSTNVSVMAEVNKKEELGINIQLNISKSKFSDSHVENIKSNENQAIVENTIEPKKFSLETIPNIDKKSKEKFTFVQIPRKESEADKVVLPEAKVPIENQVTRNSAEDTISNSNVNNTSVDNQFMERPKGRAVNKINLSNVIPVQLLNEEKIHIPTNINRNDKPLCQDVEKKENQITTGDFIGNQTNNYLTNHKSNPFLMTQAQSNDNNPINQTSSVFVNNQSTAANNIYMSNNLIGFNLNSNNQFNAINSIQASSPSSSTYSDVTFANKNISDSTTNHYNSNLNTNAFSGNHYTQGMFNNSHLNINNNLKNNLATVCEDEGRMSVEKQDVAINYNTHGDNNFNYNNGANQLSTNNFHNNNQFTAPGFNSIATNSHPFPSQQMSNIQNQFNKDPFGKSNNNNHTNGHPNVFNTFTNTNLSNNRFPSSSSFTQPENRNVFPTPGPSTLNDNPFMGFTKNNNNGNTKREELGLFKEQGFQPRKQKR